MNAPEPRSYWHLTFPITLETQPLPESADLVVVGAGVLGVNAAYAGARAGARVVLIDQFGPAEGATGRNGGFLTEGTALGYARTLALFGHETARAMWQLTVENRALARQIIGEEGLDCWYRETGHLDFSLDAQDWEADQASVEALRRDGFYAESLTPAQTQALVGTPLSAEIVGARYTPQCGLLHSSRLAGGLAAAAVRRGAVLARATVTGIEDERVITDQGTITARGIVIAANAWTHRLAPVTRELIVPVRGEALSYAPHEPVFGPGMGTSVTPTGEYWQQTLDGSIVIGGCRAVAPNRDVNVLSNVATPGTQAAIEQVLPRLFPALRGLSVQHRWAGPMAFTPDYTPIADRAPGARNAWFAGGFCGLGMPFGFAFGKRLAESALSGSPSAGLRPFRLGRFAERAMP